MLHLAVDDDRPATGLPPDPKRRGAGRGKRRSLARLIAVAALAAVVFGCLVALRGQEKDDPGPREPRIAAQPEWVANGAASPMFRVAAPDGAPEPISHEVRLRRGGGRQDIFVFGDLSGDGPVARLTLSQVGDARAPVSAFFVALARMAADAGRSVAFSAQPDALPTRLGMFEAAEAQLRRRSGGSSKCVGFRNVSETGAPLAITGFACAGSEPNGAAPPMRQTAACLIDAIELLPAVDDPPLAAAFAERELRQITACGADQSMAFDAPILRKSLDYGFSLSAR